MDYAAFFDVQAHLGKVLVPALLIEVTAAQVLGRRRELFDLSDSAANFACIVGQNIGQAVLRYGPLVGYAYVYEHYAFVRLSVASPWTFVAGLLLVDLAYYWWHRANHRVALFWAVHAVHHSSNQLNLTINWRFSWIADIYVWLFYMPLAVLGFPPSLIATALVLNSAWGFLTHTRLVPKLGPLEWLLVTPSHHRVHHGGDDKYRDRNYGSMLIVWDRLFGSFQVEQEEPRYGLEVPQETNNPLRINLAPWADLLREARASEGLRGALRVLLLPPGTASTQSVPLAVAPPTADSR